MMIREALADPLSAHQLTITARRHEINPTLVPMYVTFSMRFCSIILEEKNPGRIAEIINAGKAKYQLVQNAAEKPKPSHERSARLETDRNKTSF